MDKNKAAVDYCNANHKGSDSKYKACYESFIAGFDNALSTQSPKWVKAKDGLPGDGVESLKEMPLRDAITKVPYHKVDILGFDNKTMYYRGINDDIHVKIKNIEWQESSTHPLQAKITELLEENQRLKETLESAYALSLNAADTIATALETYK